MNEHFEMENLPDTLSGTEKLYLLQKQVDDLKRDNTALQNTIAEKTAQYQWLLDSRKASDDEREVLEKCLGELLRKEYSRWLADNEYCEGVENGFEVYCQLNGYPFTPQPY